ncbi:hypothetical protein TNCV_4858671 [Trichonephila clavipes]|nr:hypothetical protein TNCV_4858671 [Trichonephila clavipes]
MKYSSHNSTQQCGTVETIDLTSEYSVRGKSGVRCAPSTNPKWSKGCSPSSHGTDFPRAVGITDYPEKYRQGRNSEARQELFISHGCAFSSQQWTC